MARQVADFSRSFWFRARSRSWSGDAKLLALYLMFCPHGNALGCFWLPKPYACADLGWQPDRLETALRQLLEDGFADYDERNAVVLVPSHLECSPIENPNQAKAAKRALSAIPASPLMLKLADILELKRKPFLSELVAACREIASKAVGAEQACQPLLRPVSGTLTETVSETVPRTVSETVSRTVSETLSRTVSETVAETVPQTVPETVSETVSQTICPAVSRPVVETVRSAVSPTGTAPAEAAAPQKRGRKRLIPVFAANSVQFELACFLRDRILENLPDARVPEPTPEGMRRWAHDVDLMMRIDRRSPEDIRDMMAWAQRDSFWRANILSPGKLREKWDTLAAQRLRHRNAWMNSLSPNMRRALELLERVQAEEEVVATR